MIFDVSTDYWIVTLSGTYGLPAFRNNKIMKYEKQGNQNYTVLNIACVEVWQKPWTMWNINSSLSYLLSLLHGVFLYLPLYTDMCMNCHHLYQSNCDTSGKCSFFDKFLPHSDWFTLKMCSWTPLLKWG